MSQSLLFSQRITNNLSNRCRSPLIFQRVSSSFLYQSYPFPPPPWGLELSCKRSTHLPWAHWKGNWHLDRRSISSRHSMTPRGSPNFTAPKHKQTEKKQTLWVFFAGDKRSGDSWCPLKWSPKRSIFKNPSSKWIILKTLFLSCQVDTWKKDDACENSCWGGDKTYGECKCGEWTTDRLNLFSRQDKNILTPHSVHTMTGLGADNFRDDFRNRCWHSTSHW